MVLSKGQEWTFHQDHTKSKIAALRRGRTMSSPARMRRQDLAMDEARTQALLTRGFCGRLATVGVDGAPYCTTMLYVWTEGRIHLHGTRARGHLRSNIDHEPRACFAIDEPGPVFDYGRFECDSTISYASVLVF
jgi:nitroimidazol reductase NimA-like FMN-containing flavoprotein (pyridoxamine 5'-phosphate oxidase superfamily)